MLIIFKNSFIPLNKYYEEKNKFIKFNHTYKYHQYSFSPSKKPFFSVINENIVPKRFIEAVMKDCLDDAQNYISKSFDSIIDVNAIVKLFKKNYSYQHLININSKKADYSIKSIMIKDAESKYVGILHFYLIKEPDGFSNWKIFKVTRE